MSYFRSLLPVAGGVLVGGIAGLVMACCCCGVGLVALVDRQGRLWTGAVLLWPFGAGCGALGGGVVAAVTAYGDRRRWRLPAVLTGVLLGAVAAVPIAYLPAWSSGYLARAKAEGEWVIQAFAGAVFGLIGAVAALAWGRRHADASQADGRSVPGAEPDPPADLERQ